MATGWAGDGAVQAPGLPAGLGRKSVQVSGAVTHTAKGTGHLRGGAVVLTTHHTLNRTPPGYRDIDLGRWAP